MMGDVIVCDFNSTSRADAMKDLLKTSEAKKTDEVSGFGNSFNNNDVRFLSYTQLATNPSSNNVARVIRQVTSDNKRGIAKGKSGNVFYDMNLKCFKTCENWIPLSYCPIIIELYLVNDATLPIIAQGATADFTATNTSNSWAIKKPVIKATGVYSIDDSLYAEYSNILETGSLPITFETETMQEQTTSASTEIFTTIVRNVSKLNKIYISFSNTTSTGYVGGFGEILKEYNSLYHPLAHQGSAVDVGYYDPTYDLTASLVIGNQVIPSQEIQGVREAYVHLMHCADNPLLVRSEDYKTQAFMFGFNLQKLESAAYTGLNSKNNSNLVVKIRPLDGSTLYSSDFMPTRMYIHMVHECILEIRSNSVTFYD